MFASKDQNSHFSSDSLGWISVSSCRYKQIQADIFLSLHQTLFIFVNCRPASVVRPLSSCPSHPAPAVWLVIQPQTSRPSRPTPAVWLAIRPQSPRPSRPSVEVDVQRLLYLYSYVSPVAAETASMLTVCVDRSPDQAENDVLYFWTVEHNATFVTVAAVTMVTTD